MKSKRSYLRELSCHSACCILLAAIPALPQAASPTPAAATAPPDAPPVKKQLPADQRAYKAARSIDDPEQCLAAMHAFLHDYPKSDRIGRAQDAIFGILLKSFPQRTGEIDAQAKLLVKRAGKGDSKFNQETYIAYQLAEAKTPDGTFGIDLPLAEKLAKDPIDHLNEATYTASTLKNYAKFKVPPPTTEVMHHQFAHTKAEALSVLADVYLRQGKPPQSASLTSEAVALDPMIDDVQTMQGRLALLDHEEAKALDAFEQAQLLGALPAQDRATVMDLYRKAHNNSDDGFAAELDTRYATLFPPAFTPTKPADSTTGRTVLVELFTGSGCEPCVGGDLAVEGLLKTYPHTELVALAFDQHIPEPDPLTNPDSVARADFYDVAHTPTYLVDGTTQNSIFGGDRLGSKDLYDKLAKTVDTEAAIPTNIQIKLQTASASGGIVQAHATVTLPSTEDLKKSLIVKADPDPTTAATGAKSKPETKPVPTAPKSVAAEPNIIVNFALVEDDIRYSGENGIRFHRMVVRALAKPAYTGFAATPSGPGSSGIVTLDATFDPAAISQALVTYLDSYEQKNDRFGKIRFLTKDTTMNPKHLAVAVWVQDSVTHRVLQSTLVKVAPVDTEPKAAE